MSLRVDSLSINSSAVPEVLASFELSYWQRGLDDFLHSHWMVFLKPRLLDKASRWAKSLLLLTCYKSLLAPRKARRAHVKS